MARLNELETLYRIEFANPRERILRYAAILLGAIPFHLQNQHIEALLWPVTYIGGHLLLQAGLLRWRHAPTPARRWVIYLLGALTVLGLVWYPVYLIVSGRPAAIFGAAAVLGCTYFYAISRSDRTTSSVRIWVGMFCCTIAVVATWLVMTAEATIDIAVVVIASFAFLGYFLYAMQTARRLRSEVAEAAERELQEQKLAAIGKLAGGVAHDFNNALTGILGNLELYSEINDPLERQELVQAARASADRAGRLVKQLLIFSRKSNVEFEIVDAQVLIKEAAAFKRRLVPANVSVEVAENPPLWISVDQNLMVAGLINLVVNSVDAMPGGGTLNLSAEQVFLPEPLVGADGRKVPRGDYACLTVRDTGEGIPEDVFPRVLEPFFSTKPAGKAAGLGLSMLIGLMESHNGGLQISTGATGTTVSLFIPLADEGVR